MKTARGWRRIRETTRICKIKYYPVRLESETGQWWVQFANSGQVHITVHRGPMTLPHSSNHLVKDSLTGIEKPQPGEKQLFPPVGV